jgi:predicted ABC-type transport system involved in lysophospholipase L1 biosynthesis ATPase subunit
VLVTHDISIARRAHRIVQMRDGMIENDKQNGKGAQDG